MKIRRLITTRVLIVFCALYAVRAENEPAQYQPLPAAVAILHDGGGGGGQDSGAKNELAKKSVSSSTFCTPCSNCGKNSFCICTVILLRRVTCTRSKGHCNKATLYVDSYWTESIFIWPHAIKNERIKGIETMLVAQQCASNVPLRSVI